MKAVFICAVLLAALCMVAHAEVFYKEDFSGDWSARWVQSKHKSDFGKFEGSHGEFFGDAKEDIGIKTSQDARFYAISSAFDKKVSNEGKTLVVQFSVKHEQRIDCGGGYAKILRAGYKPADVHGETPYAIMFGPDICGPTKRIHAIFNYNGENLLWKKTVDCETDVHTHVYTLIVKPDNTYSVLVDNVERASGSLYDDWDFLAPRRISDPNDKKPADWVDEAEIADPEDVKPADWDVAPAQIADPEAKKPEDWDDDLDGEWEPPMIDNPEYKGEWKARMIPNPAYKGVWKAREIDNPEFKDDPAIYRQTDMSGIAFDLWQVRAGTIFDNVLITDDEKTAEDAAEKILARVLLEKDAYNKKQEEDRKAAEAASASAPKTGDEEYEDEVEEEAEEDEQPTKAESAEKQKARQEKLDKLKKKAAEADKEDL